ncbi:sugar transferase [Actinomadura rugatobispora]|uniref:Sugar transferase n=1 Tax=Actinomadura rugatobispora TaxID=1994 RepID=A0ABW1AJE4_9ACTN|nr:hypothetical protein GCM10010200_029880 [Actinomadura rugatobispora]
MGSQGLSVPAVGGDVEDGADEGREERSEDDPGGRHEGHAGQAQQAVGGGTRTLTATSVIPVVTGPAARPATASRPRPLAALYALTLGTADALAMATAVTVAAGMVNGTAAGGTGAGAVTVTGTVTAMVTAAAAIVAVNAPAGLHRCRRRPSLLDDAPALAVRAAVVAAPAALLLPGGGSVAIWLWITCLYCAFAGASRLAAGAVLRTHRKLRPRGRPTVIIGTGPGAALVAGVLRRRRDFGLDPVGQIVTGDPGDLPVPALPVLGRPLDLRRALAACTETRSRAAVVIVADEVRRSGLDELVRICAALPCETLLVPSTTDLLLARAGARTAQAPVEHLEGIPFVRLGPRPGARTARAAKRAFDTVAAALLLLTLWPVLLACALAVRIEGGPGVLFRQRRVGLDGEPFTLLKFRSLRPADDHEADTRWSVDGDARMGPVGRFLRETSLDELPQLWNVVRGDMSLVGPRPERPHFVRLFSETCPEYPLRHRMPVGITGWAQVNGLRGDTSIELRVRLDNRYIDTWTFGADLRILLMTVRAVLTRNVA